MADTILGTDGTHDVSISLWDRRQGMYIIGASGTGKSVLIENMVSQDIADGVGVCVIDPHGDLTNAIINRIKEERLNDVILLNPLERDAFGLNIYSCSNPSNMELVEDTVNQVMEVFDKIFGVDRESPLTIQVLRHTAITILENGLTMAEIPALIFDEPFRARVLKNVTNPQTKYFWQMYERLRPDEKDKWAGTAFRRIDEFLSSYFIRTIVGQQVSTINFREIMDTQKILLCRLPGKLKAATSLLGATIIGQIYIAALSRENIPERKRRFFGLYVDEFQRYATPAMADMFFEGRKYGILSTLAHQSRDQLDDANKGSTMQARSKIVFAVGSGDAQELAGEFDHTPPRGDLIERPVRVPAQEVIRHLFTKGHENPEVNKLVTDYIRPLYGHPVNSSSDGTYYHSPAGFYEKQKNEELRYVIYPFWENVENLLNRFLVQMMEGSIQLASPAYEQALYDAILSLSGYLHFNLYYLNEPYENTAGEYRVGVISTVLPSKIGVVGNETIYQANVRVSNEIFRLIVQAHLKEDCYMLLREPIARRTKFWEQIVNDPKTAHENAMRECNEVLHFCNCIGLLGYRLSQSPILVDSGKYEKVEGPRRTYNDMQNAIANDLVSLPKGTAMAKTPGGEWKITTYEPKKMDSGFPRKLATIKKNTREKYCRERAEVEREIATRIRSDNPPPTQRKHTLE